MGVSIDEWVDLSIKAAVDQHLNRFQSRVRQHAAELEAELDKFKFIQNQDLQNLLNQIDLVLKLIDYEFKQFDIEDDYELVSITKFSDSMLEEDDDEVESMQGLKEKEVDESIVPNPEQKIEPQQQCHLLQQLQLQREQWSRRQQQQPPQPGSMQLRPQPLSQHQLCSSNFRSMQPRPEQQVVQPGSSTFPLMKPRPRPEHQPWQQSLGPHLLGCSNFHSMQPRPEQQVVQPGSSTFPPMQAHLEHQPQQQSIGANLLGCSNFRSMQPRLEQQVVQPGSSTFPPMQPSPEQQVVQPGSSTFRPMHPHPEHQPRHQSIGPNLLGCSNYRSMQPCPEQQQIVQPGSSTFLPIQPHRDHQTRQQSLGPNLLGYSNFCSMQSRPEQQVVQPGSSTQPRSEQQLRQLLLSQHQLGSSNSCSMQPRLEQQPVQPRSSTFFQCSPFRNISYGN
ncbi:hypothetical protein V6N13_060448 [Hibiscus sabdariffa]|uniref:Uncharacterized protein n=1 Tax=Hibiscus sabdariffa TaxID=183260 RepID=A0ABR2GA10_9ROSI